MMILYQTTSIIKLNDKTMNKVQESSEHTAGQDLRSSRQEGYDFDNRSGVDITTASSDRYDSNYSILTRMDLGDSC